MHRAAALAATIALFGLAACLGFDELQGGEDAGADAATSNDSSISDATNDTGNLGDSAIDAGFDAGNSFCSKNPGHSFCDDFDESTDYLASGWTTPFITSPSNLVVTSDASVSAPSSLLASVAASSSMASARLAKAVVPVDVTHVHVEFDVQMCELSDAGMYEIFKLGFNDISTSTGIDFQVKSSSAYIAANGNVYPLKVNLTQAWTHVAIDLHLGDGGTSLAAISFDGSPVGPQDASITPATIDFDAGFLSIVGLYGIDAPACTAYFDNVVMDYE
jgi:hypothetical protein